MPGVHNINVPLKSLSTASVGASALLAGVALMSHAPAWSSWFLAGWSLALGGFGYCLVLILFYWRWNLMSFPCVLAREEIRRFTAKELYTLLESSPHLYKKLCELNPRHTKRQR